VQYSYDGYQRLTQVSRPDGTHDDYTYNSYSGSQNAWGRLILSPVLDLGKDIRINANVPHMVG
jgi:hypothetical protein